MIDNPREIILSSAKEIALAEGIKKVNIRLVAQMSGISIGTVYNYYNTKAELLVAVIEDFWAEAFREIDLKSLDDKSFFEKIEDIYYRLNDYLQQFKADWLDQMSLLTVEEKKIGRIKEKEFHSSIYSLIVSLMDRDKDVSKTLLNNNISKTRVAEFIFDNMLIMLKKDEKDFSFFISLLKKLLSD